jgi:hypothetical protein
VPANGVLNYTTVNIPAGVTVTFAKNATNTPVVMLVGGDATIAGTIDVSGTPGAATGAAGDGNVGDDGTPGTAGPGGFNGGQGGRVDSTVANRISQAGQGPGGAGPAAIYMSGGTPLSCGGGGGGFGTAGALGHGTCGTVASAGTSYGASGLLPLVGGSGGGGGAGGTVMRGAGGGAGGGAVLIAASGTLSVSGAIRANGGAGGTIAGAGVGGAGGGGSGGAIRLIATTITGNGAISAAGGAGQTSVPSNDLYRGGNGAPGRIRFEAETYTRTAASTPEHSFGTPGPAFVAGLPTLRISKVAGVDAPAAPTGNADIALPETTTNPVPVQVATTGVPVGNTVTVVVTPTFGATTSHISNALSGTADNATADVNVTLPPGPSTLLATVTYSVPASLAKQSPYRELSGEDDPIERVAMEARSDGSLRRTGITRDGREIDLSNVVAFGQ